MKDINNEAVENFVSEQSAADFAKLYAADGVKGGHIILLNSPDSEYFEETKQQAIEALHAYPGGLQIGGGITDENASFYIKEGASHVIVTSFVFKDGKINFRNLDKLVEAVGKEHVVLDLSCRYFDGWTFLKGERIPRKEGYYIVTDRWQKYSAEQITVELFDVLASYCDEFLIHAVDVEGKQNGIQTGLVKFLGKWGKVPITYAGGVHTFEDLETIRELGRGNLNVTIGSALDLFGGTLKYKEVLEYMNIK